MGKQLREIKERYIEYIFIFRIQQKTSDHPKSFPISILINSTLYLYMSAIGVVQSFEDMELIYHFEILFQKCIRVSG